MPALCSPKQKFIQNLKKILLVIFTKKKGMNVQEQKFNLFERLRN